MVTLNVKAFALALGVPWSLCMLLTGWAAWLFHWGTGFVAVMASIYIGFAPTFPGGIIGGLWAFADGLIAGAVIAWIYNKAAAK